MDTAGIITPGTIFKFLVNPSAYRRGAAGQVPYQAVDGERLEPSQFLERAQQYAAEQSRGHLHENYHLGGRMFLCGFGSFISVLGAAATDNPRTCSVMCMLAIFGISGLYFGNHYHQAAQHQKLFLKYEALGRRIATKRHYFSTYGYAEAPKFVPELEKEMTRLHNKNDIYFHKAGL